MMRRCWFLLAESRRPPAGRRGIMSKAIAPTPTTTSAASVSAHNTQQQNHATTGWPHTADLHDSWEAIPEHHLDHRVDDDAENVVLHVEEEEDELEDVGDRLLDDVDMDATPDEMKEHTTTTAASDGGQPTEAYRFLLDHIDAEIAALRRRHKNVVERRSNMEDRQIDRVRQVLEFLERPWTLLPTELAPALPATGIEVYVKEQQLRQRQQHEQESNEAVRETGAPLTADGAEKVSAFVEACHNTYKNLRAEQRRPYEVAAAENEKMRGELRRRLRTGCANFESFCANVVECTADKVRGGELATPATTTTSAEVPQNRATAPSTRRMMAAKVHPPRGHAATHQITNSNNNNNNNNANVQRPGLLVSPGGGFSVSAAAREAREARRRLAASRLRSLAATSAAPPAVVEEVPQTSTRNRGGARATVRAAAKRVSKTLAASKRTKTSPTNTRTTTTTGNKHRGSKKTSSHVGIRSIPLPDLDRLAAKIQRGGAQRKRGPSPPSSARKTVARQPTNKSAAKIKAPSVKRPAPRKLKMKKRSAKRR